MAASFVLRGQSIATPVERVQLRGQGSCGPANAAFDDHSRPLPWASHRPLKFHKKQLLTIDTLGCTMPCFRAKPKARADALSAPIRKLIHGRTRPPNPDYCRRLRGGVDQGA